MSARRAVGIDCCLLRGEPGPKKLIESHELRFSYALDVDGGIVLAVRHRANRQPGAIATLGVVLTSGQARLQA